MTKSRSRAGGAPLLAAFLAAAATNATECDPGSPGEAVQAQQKIRLLQRLTSDSAPLQRLRDSGDQAALATLDNALAIMASAQQALLDGCRAEAAALSNEALRLATEAFRASPAAEREARDDFDAELDQARSLLASLQGRPLQETGLTVEALDGIERQLGHAATIAESGSVDEARQLLQPVNDRLRRRVLEMFDQRTLYYEHEFQSPADEYSYLVRQYDGYMLLLQSGTRTTPYSARQRVADMLGNAGRSRERAMASEAAGAWSDAIAAMNAALEYCEQAARATGYAF